MSGTILELFASWVSQEQYWRDGQSTNPIRLLIGLPSSKINGKLLHESRINPAFTRKENWRVGYNLSEQNGVSERISGFKTKIQKLGLRYAWLG